MVSPIAIRPPCPRLQALDQARATLGWSQISLDGDGGHWYLVGHGSHHRTTCRIDLLENAFAGENNVQHVLRQMRSTIGP